MTLSASDIADRNYWERWEQRQRAEAAERYADEVATRRVFGANYPGYRAFSDGLHQRQNPLGLSRSLYDALCSRKFSVGDGCAEDVDAQCDQPVTCSAVVENRTPILIPRYSRLVGTEHTSYNTSVTKQWFTSYCDNPPKPISVKPTNRDPVVKVDAASIFTVDNWSYEERVFLVALRTNGMLEAASYRRLRLKTSDEISKYWTATRGTEVSVFDVPRDPLVGTASVESVACVECGRSDQEEYLLLCDCCDEGYHTFCCNIKNVPEGTWFCARCRPLVDVPGGPPVLPKEVIPRAVEISRIRCSARKFEEGIAAVKSKTTLPREFFERPMPPLVSRTSVKMSFLKNRHALTMHFNSLLEFMMSERTALMAALRQRSEIIEAARKRRHKNRSVAKPEQVKKQRTCSSSAQLQSWVVTVSEAALIQLRETASLLVQDSRVDSISVGDRVILGLVGQQVGVVEIATVVQVLHANTHDGQSTLKAGTLLLNNEHRLERAIPPVQLRISPPLACVCDLLHNEGALMQLSPAQSKDLDAALQWHGILVNISQNQRVCVYWKDASPAAWFMGTVNRKEHGRFVIEYDDGDVDILSPVSAPMYMDGDGDEKLCVRVSFDTKLPSHRDMRRRDDEFYGHVGCELLPICVYSPEDRRWYKASVALDLSSSCHRLTCYEDGKWEYLRFSKRGKCVDRDGVMKTYVSGNREAAFDCARLLSEIMQAEVGIMLLEPVDFEEEDSEERLDRIGLACVGERLSRDCYPNLEAMKSDVRCVCRRAMRVYKEGSQHFRSAQRLLTYLAPGTHGYEASENIFLRYNAMATGVTERADSVTDAALGCGVTAVSLDVPKHEPAMTPGAASTLDTPKIRMDLDSVDSDAGQGSDCAVRSPPGVSRNQILLQPFQNEMPVESRSIDVLNPPPQISDFAERVHQGGPRVVENSVDDLKFESSASVDDCGAVAEPGAVANAAPSPRSSQLDVQLNDDNGNGSKMDIRAEGMAQEQQPHSGRAMTGHGENLKSLMDGCSGTSRESERVESEPVSPLEKPVMESVTAPCTAYSKSVFVDIMKSELRAHASGLSREYADLLCKELVDGLPSSCDQATYFRALQLCAFRLHVYKEALLEQMLAVVDGQKWKALLMKSSEN